MLREARPKLASAAPDVLAGSGSRALQTLNTFAELPAPMRDRSPIVYTRRDTIMRFFLAALAVLGVAGAAAQSPLIDTSRIGPGIGTQVPEFSGTDQFGRTHTLASSLGPQGAMLVFFRSADW